VKENAQVSEASPRAACTAAQGRQAEKGAWLSPEKCVLMQEEGVLTMVFTFVLSGMKGILAVKNL